MTSLLDSQRTLIQNVRYYNRQFTSINTIITKTNIYLLLDNEKESMKSSNVITSEGNYI
jgi:hypothetical protein